MERSESFIAAQPNARFVMAWSCEEHESASAAELRATPRRARARRQFLPPRAQNDTHLAETAAESSAPSAAQTANARVDNGGAST
jgi:hypothetical protein